MLIPFRVCPRQALLNELRASDPADPSKPVLVPADPERIAMAEVDGKQKGAIKYTPDHITCYRDLAKKLGIKPMQHVVL